jgi:hypothetical protein
MQLGLLTSISAPARPIIPDSYGAGASRFTLQVSGAGVIGRQSLNLRRNTKLARFV